MMTMTLKNIDDGMVFALAAATVDDGNDDDEEEDGSQT